MDLLQLLKKTAFSIERPLLILPEGYSDPKFQLRTFHPVFKMIPKWAFRFF
jgi:hypothetical protein